MSSVVDANGIRGTMYNTRPPTSEAHMKRDKTERATYIPPPLAESGRKRTVVNLPSDRIRMLLEVIDAWEAYEAEIISWLSRINPELVEQLPTPPDKSYVEAERMYQRVRGKYNEANRHRTRLARIRQEMGLTPINLNRVSPERQAELMREVEAELSRSSTIDPSRQFASDGSPQRDASTIAAEMNAEPVPQPIVTVIETVIETKPGLVDIDIKEDES